MWGAPPAPCHRQPLVDLPKGLVVHLVRAVEHHHENAQRPPCSRLSGINFRISGMHLSGFQIQDFQFRASHFGFRVSSFEFRVSGFGFWDSERLNTTTNVPSVRPASVRVSDTRFPVSGIKFRISGANLRVSGANLRISGFWFCGIIFGRN